MPDTPAVQLDQLDGPQLVLTIERLHSTPDYGARAVRVAENMASGSPLWLTPDQADALAASLTALAAQARAEHQAERAALDYTDPS